MIGLYVVKSHLTYFCKNLSKDVMAIKTEVNISNVPEEKVTIINSLKRKKKKLNLSLIH